MKIISKIAKAITPGLVARPVCFRCGLLQMICALLFSTMSLHSATFTTIANGNWSSSSTWQSGSIPGSTLNNGDVILIRHTVNYNLGTNIIYRGTIRIEPILGTQARLNIPTGVNIELQSTGRMYVHFAAFSQFRFSSNNHGQPYSGNSPTASINSGTFKNIGGYLSIYYSYVEVAQDWVSESGGVRTIRNGCLYTGQNYTLSGSSSRDTLIDVTISVGWHGSGNFDISDGSIHFQDVRIQMAGTSGNVKFNSGVANGNLEYISLRNHIVPFTGSGSIEASSSLTVTPGLTLDAYCAQSSSNFIQNGKFSGSRSLNCGLNYFSQNCDTLVVLNEPVLTLQVEQTVEGNAHLIWYPVSGKGFKSFVIQRSDDDYNWQPIGEVESTEHDTEQLFQYIDYETIQDECYYRLQGIEKSGVRIFSPSHQFNPYLSYNSIRLFPNPATVATSVELNTPQLKSSEIDLQLYNALGRQVEIFPVKSLGTYEFDLDHLPNGVYKLRITGLKEVVNRQLIIRR